MQASGAFGFSLTGTSLGFDRAGRRVLVIDAAGIAMIDVAGSQALQLPVRDAQAVAGFDDQLWVVARDGELTRFDPAGRPLGEGMSLPCAPRAALVTAPCGPAAAVWTVAPPIGLVDERGQLARIEHPRADLVLPIAGRRAATVMGSRLALPSGQILPLAPHSTVLGGAVLADGKRLALLLASTAARSGEHHLVVVSLTTAQVVLRCAIPSTGVRLAVERGLAIVQLEPRVLWGVDLRSGRELGTITLDSDVIDHAVDPAGRWLAVRNATGEVELLNLSDAVRTAAAIGTIPAPAVEHEDPPAAPDAAARESSSASVEFARSRRLATVAPRSSRTPRAPAVIARPRAARIAARGRFAHGRFIAPTDAVREITLRSAADESDVIGVFASGADDLDDAVASAAGALAGWSGLAVEARIAVLGRLEQTLSPQLGEISAILQRELGRPAWECRRELDGLVPRLVDLCAVARAHLAPTGRTRTARMEHRPLGVVAILGPAMFPLATSHNHILAALIAGNTVVWKPSPLAAASAQTYVELLHQVGLPPGAINLVQGDDSVGRELVAHPRVDAVVFAGSRDNAREIRRAACDRLDQPVLLHAGSKNPAVVLDGADLRHTACELVQAAFLTAGQRCTAMARVLVHEPLLDPLLEALVAQTERLASHVPAVIGPMFSRPRYDQFLARLAAAEADGAQVVLPPETRLDSLRVGPSIHVVGERDRAADYLGRELFGPDLAVEPVADLGDAITRLRGHGALFASLFSTDADRWTEFQREVEAGALLWNHAPAAVSGRLSFAAPGAPERGARALLAMTRRTAYCEASTGVALPFELARNDEPVRAVAQGSRS